MKKIICFIILAIFCFVLCSCPYDVYIYPDMVEYSEEDVINKAKEKYSFSYVVFQGRWITGEKEYDENGKLLIDKLSSVKIFESDNLDAAFEAFAGKNGGHDIQGYYSYFICYYGLGKRDDGSYLFFYYNTNINKNAKLEDTIGMSSYNYDVLPNELFKYEVKIPYNLGSVAIDINNKTFKSTTFNFDKDRLSYSSYERTFLDKDDVRYRIEFYRENGIIVYDLYILDKEDILIYSTSEIYGHIEYSYGMDLNEYFNMECKIEELDDKVNFNCKSELKEINGNILYNYFYYALVIDEKRDLNSDTSYVEGFHLYSYDSKFECEFSKDKYEGNDYSEISNFTIRKFYVFYEKNK